MTCQFDNKINFNTHKNHSQGNIKIRLFVSGVVTEGTIPGVGEVLNANVHKYKVIAVEPLKASVLSGKQVKPHIIQGIGFGFVPSV